MTPPTEKIDDHSIAGWIEEQRGQIVAICEECGNAAHLLDEGEPCDPHYWLLRARNRLRDLNNRMAGFAKLLRSV